MIGAEKTHSLVDNLVEGFGRVSSSIRKPRKRENIQSLFTVSWGIPGAGERFLREKKWWFLKERERHNILPVAG